MQKAGTAPGKYGSPDSIIDGTPHTPLASPRSAAAWLTIEACARWLYNVFAVFGLLSAIALAALRSLDGGVALYIAGSSAVAAAVLLVIVDRCLHSDSTVHGASVGAFANPLWKTKPTWRMKEGGMPGKPPAMTPLRVSHVTAAPTLIAAGAVAGASPAHGDASEDTSRRLFAAVPSDTKITEATYVKVPHLAALIESSGGGGVDNALGEGVIHDYLDFTDGSDVVLADIVRINKMAPASRVFLRAGPRRTLYFNAREVRAAVVTCGGLCPGLNNVVREVTKSLLNLYSAESVLGVRGGYWGFHDASEWQPMELTHEAVEGIQHKGGTILGSSRGGFDLDQTLHFCKRHRISQLYIIGGDGTHRAANIVGLAAMQQRLRLTVAGIPKTIDNDLDIIDRSFGFDSAVEAAQDAVRSASTEAMCNLPNGIGIVKLMGRHAGFIAAHATLASGDVDLCLVPEVPIELEGTYGVLPHLERVLKVKGRAVVIVAEGAGEELCAAATTVDAGGNKALPEIGPFIKARINEHFKAIGVPVSVKYVDPSYMIRSVPANASDSLLCMLLAQGAVHGSMAGHTCFTTGVVNNRTVYLPIPALVDYSPRGLKRGGRTWERIISVTGQPNRPEDGSRSSSPAQQRNSTRGAVGKGERRVSIF